MKIVAFNYMGGQRVCIMDNGSGISAEHIKDDTIIGSTVEEIDGRYTVTGAGDASCTV